LQPWEQIDLPAKVETVRRKTRPWKSIIALLLAIATAVVSSQLRRVARHRVGDTGGLFANAGLNHIVAVLCWVAATLAFLAFASIATINLAGKAKEVLEPKTGASHAAVTRYAILIIGAFTTLVVTLQLFGVPIGQLVLGGALTSVFVGIAAQQALSNVFAGLVLLFARPFRVGDEIRLRAGALGGQIDGVVTDIGITYVRLFSAGSVISVPNAQVLNAVVGPVPPPSLDAGAGSAPAAVAPAAQPSGAPPASPSVAPTASTAVAPAAPAQTPVTTGQQDTVVDEGNAVNPGGPSREGLRPPGPA
jgi:small-conductance mechanosensitive channel